jgi:hypothetical protein
MTTPDPDDLLRELRQNPPPMQGPTYSGPDEALLRRMIAAAKANGNIGVFIVGHRDGEIEYMIVRGNRPQGIHLAARFIERQADLLQ